MKKLATVLLFFLVSMFFTQVSADAQIAKSWRSADPCNIWEKWQSGPGRVNTLELRDGKASHMSPARILRYSSLENKINPFLPLAIMKYLNQIPFEAMDNPEGRLLYSMMYAIDEDGNTKYPGFYPQIVAATYQLDLARTRKELFMEACEKYFQLKDKEEIRLIYDWYVWEISRITGHIYHSSLDSIDVYDHFQGKEITTAVIQSLLYQIHSPLADVNLFRRKPLDKSFYDNIQCPE